MSTLSGTPGPSQRFDSIVEFLLSSLRTYNSMRSSLVIAILILCGLTPPSCASVRSNHDGKVLLLDHRRHHRGTRVADVPQPVLVDEFSRMLSVGDIPIPRYVLLTFFSVKEISTFVSPSVDSAFLFMPKTYQAPREEWQGRIWQGRCTPNE